MFKLFDRFNDWTLTVRPSWAGLVIFLGFYMFVISFILTAFALFVFLLPGAFFLLIFGFIILFFISLFLALFNKKDS